MIYDQLKTRDRIEIASPIDARSIGQLFLSRIERWFVGVFAVGHHSRIAGQVRHRRGMIAVVLWFQLFSEHLAIRFEARLFVERHALWPVLLELRLVRLQNIRQPVVRRVEFLQVHLCARMPMVPFHQVLLVFSLVDQLPDEARCGELAYGLLLAELDRLIARFRMFGHSAFNWFVFFLIDREVKG